LLFSMGSLVGRFSVAVEVTVVVVADEVVVVVSLG
jgi:hypothetical protein